MALSRARSSRLVREEARQAQKSTMTSRFVFMNDPSLACKETKKRGQLMSEVNAHNSRWRHSGSGSRGESQQNTIEEAVARGHRVRIVTSQNQSAVSRVRTSQSSIPLKVPMNLVPVTSPYLTQVYTGSSVTRISRLFDICRLHVCHMNLC